jgi:uncharacterized protein YecT (DUF1311 family)
MKIISIAVAMMAVIPSAAQARDSFYPVQDCNKAVVQMDLNECTEANFEAADKALNDVYKSVMAAQTDDASREQLRQSERTWIAFRDRECARQVGPREGGGSIWPMDMALCLQDQTDKRIRELKRSLDCPNGPNAPCTH